MMMGAARQGFPFCGSKTKACFKDPGYVSDDRVHIGGDSNTKAPALPGIAGRGACLLMKGNYWQFWGYEGLMHRSVIFSKKSPGYFLDDREQRIVRRSASLLQTPGSFV
jgi:hypothetical protein